jgi:cell shape-determining protein MreD
VRYWTGGSLACSLALFQASSVQDFRILGVTPNLVLVLLVAWLVVRGLDDVLPMIAVSGITMAFVGLQTPGLVLLALLPIAALGVVRELHVVHSDLLLVLTLVVAASVAYEAVVLLGALVAGGRFDLVTGFRSAVVPSALVNAALAPPVYLVMRLARPGNRHRLSY